MIGVTSSGQETLEKLATLVDVPTEEEISNMSKKLINGEFRIMDLETIQEMKKELELALINLNEGASDEKYSGLLGVASVLGKLNAMEKIHLTQNGSCDTL